MWFVSLYLLCTVGQNPDQPARPAKPAADLALAYLAREVPRWARENKCYSCHNNGDAARALYAALRLGRAVPPNGLADTSHWLARPERWDHNGPDGPFSDKKLARLQFAVALSAAWDAGQVKDRASLARAAELVAEHQETDGSWQVDAAGSVGSPVTYGAALATSLARQTLLHADVERYRDAIARADRWLLRKPARNVPEAAAVLLATAGTTAAAARMRRDAALELMRKGQGKDGGWGPYVSAAVEPFDTALAVLALTGHADQPGVREMIARGRAYLITAQQPDGSWTETTRPAGGESYAQRLSTTGWATLALLASGEK